MILTWTKRPKTETTIAARRRIWTARGGLFRVVQSISLYGLSVRWYACRYCQADRCWDVISRHRKKARALQACQRAAQ